MQTQKVLSALMLLALAAMIPVAASSAPLVLPDVDGRFYGNNDWANYSHHAEALAGRGTLYWTLAGDSLYLAIEVSPTVNDNVFGKLQGSPTDKTYVQSAGWSGGGSQHRADALTNSDAVTLTLTCDTYSWTWKQDYAYDVDTNPFNGNWKSDHLGGDGRGSGPVLESASSFQWNMNNTTWDVTLGGTRSGSSSWKSPDGLENLSTMNNTVADDNWGVGETWYWYDSDAARGWEWVMVYETRIDVATCNDAGAQIGVEVLGAHNSPPKSGDPTINIPIADFGDAPDLGYPTLLSSNWNPMDLASGGARHVLPLVGSGPMLGPTVDKDLDGQPEAHAQGDDYNDEGDDEDGICFCASPVLWGATGPAAPQVDVEVSNQPCYVNGWIDFGADGSWAEGGDQILSDLWLTAGTTHYPTFSVPSGSGWLVTYARFRCSSVNSTAGGYNYERRAPDGEVEDYELVVNDLPVEFGDLPDTYGTTVGRAGAYHIVVEDFFLGFSADGEGNGNPSPGADGDDSCPPGGDDEDGVLMPSALYPGENACVQVYLTDDSDRGGVLDGWLDFDANGWDGGDQVISAYPLTKDTWNEICFPVPLVGPPGNPGGLAPTGATIYARFRLSEAAASASAVVAAIDDVSGPTGPGGIGEVEDYKLEVPTAATVATFTAGQVGQAVVVAWETASEIDNLGFNVLRAGPEAGPRTRLNAALIPSQSPPGSPVGAKYEFVDDSVEPGVEYYYWLEAVDFSGQVEVYGPASAGWLLQTIDPGLWEQPVDLSEGGE